MGQDFKILLPREARAWECEGKLGEMLFDGTPQRLVRLLARPCVPRSGSLDSDSDAAKSDTVSEHGLALSKVVKAKRKCSAVEKTEATLSKRARLEKEDSSTSHSTQNSLVGLVTLPRELLRLVFDRLELIEDVVCLGAVDRRLWTIAAGDLLLFQGSLLGRWAGKAIVCVGEYTQPGDVPPGLFTPSEEQELREASWVPNDDLSLEAEAPPARVPITLYDLGHEQLASIELSGDQDVVRDESMRVLNNCLARAAWRDPGLYAIAPAFGLTEALFYPDTIDWILRNLTTREYVRSDAVALREDWIHGPVIDEIGFGEIVLSKICWSSSSPFGICAIPELHRGAWAGHCFDIVPWRRHLEHADVVGWTDVSEPAVSALLKLWDQNSLPDWREKLCGI